MRRLQGFGRPGPNGVAADRHFEAGAQFAQGADALRDAFIGNQLADRLVLLERGEKMGQTPHDGAPAGA